MDIKSPVSKLTGKDFPNDEDFPYEQDESHDVVKLRHVLRETHKGMTYPENTTKEREEVIRTTLAEVYKQYTDQDLTWQEIDDYDNQVTINDKPF